MFINANPRIVSNGFETFVPIQRVESLHQRLVEMTNNDVNAWSVFRPVSVTPDNWDRQNDAINGDENFPNQTLYAGYFPDTYPTVQTQDISLPKTISYTALNQGQRPSRTILPTSQRVYQNQASNMNCFENSSPMLGNDCSHWSFGHKRGSFVEFSKGGNGLKDFQYQTSNESDPASFLSSSSTATTQASYTTEPLGVGGSLSANQTIPSTVYSGYSSTNTSVDPKALTSFDTLAQDNNTSKSDWWPTVSQNSNDQCLTGFEAPLVQNGLPRYHTQQQQQISGLWNTGSNASASQITVPDTISPKVLTLNVPPLPMSSSGSSQGALVYFSDSSAVSRGRDDTADYSGSETLAVVEQPIPIRQHRAMLPALPLTSRRIVPVLPSNDSPPSKNTKKRSLKFKAGSHARTRPTPAYNNTVSSSLTSLTSTKKSEPTTSGASIPKRPEPKSTKSVQHPWNSHSQSATTEQATHHRDAKDDFLVKSKLAGMSYKDIRRQGKFTEAESTLRGRFRTLTKHKAARVRKPEWDDNDNRLLKRAVRKLTHSSDTLKSRIPWKQVAEYISNNGGSYHFGNATCRKRWDELQNRSGS